MIKVTVKLDKAAIAKIEKAVLDSAKAAMEHAAKNDFNIVIIDTAGRLHIDEDMMAELFEGMDMTIEDKIPTEFYCNCSKERVAKAVISVGKKEIQDMIDEGKDIEVKCHFCNEAYNYTVDELKELLKKSR